MGADINESRRAMRKLLEALENGSLSHSDYRRRRAVVLDRFCGLDPVDPGGSQPLDLSLPTAPQRSRSGEKMADEASGSVQRKSVKLLIALAAIILIGAAFAFVFLASGQDQADASSANASTSAELKPFIDILNRSGTWSTGQLATLSEHWNSLAADSRRSLRGTSEIRQVRDELANRRLELEALAATGDDPELDYQMRLMVELENALAQAQ